MLILLLSALQVTATTRYVVTPGTPGTPTPDYTSWETAATNIQDAVDIAGSGDLVLVKQGTYFLTNSITVAKDITLRSDNNGAIDRDGTILNGNYPATTNRCVFLDSASALLDGFTITNGYAPPTSENGNGGGILLDRGTVTNCLITGCESVGVGGGVYIDAAATLTHSTISGNVATNGNANAGGGVYIWWANGIVTDCLIMNNRSNTGGGIYMRGGNEVLFSTLKNSAIINNEAIVNVTGQGHGGIGMQFSGFIDNCVIASNKATKVVGTPYTGGVNLHSYGILLNSLVMYNTSGGFSGGVSVGGISTVVSNCVIRNNQAINGGGIHLSGTGLILDSIIVSNSSAAYCQGGTARNCLVAYNDSGLWSHTVKGSTWQNCTVVRNTGVGMRFSQSNTVENCVVYDNNNGGVNWSHDNNTTATNSVWMHSCTTPTLTGSSNTGNITDTPRFVDGDAGDFHLKGSSPCIDKGVFRDWMTGAKDLDGAQRIIALAVDMGAYEAPLPRGTLLTIR